MVLCTLIGTSETFYRIWKPLDEMLWLANLEHKQWRCLIVVISLCTCSAVLHSLWISLFVAKLFIPLRFFQSVASLILFLGE